jgi:hypothetical protein
MPSCGRLKLVDNDQMGVSLLGDGLTIAWEWPEDGLGIAWYTSIPVGFPVCTQAVHRPCRYKFATIQLQLPGGWRPLSVIRNYPYWGKFNCVFLHTGMTLLHYFY